MNNIKLITIEEHFTAQPVINANKRATPKEPESESQQRFMDFYNYRESLFKPYLIDTDKQRIEYMDQQGIEMQILSYVKPVSDKVAATEAVNICKQANDIMAERVKEHPERFRGMATLPMADPKAAALELERAIKELGLVGTMVAGQWQGHWYDEPQFLPIFEMAHELDVPVYFHPYLINPMVRDYYYMSPSYSEKVGWMFSWGAFGWHIDTGIGIVRMILSGIFDKLPNLKVISGHWGEDIPMFLDRISELLPREFTGLEKSVADYYRTNIHITPSGIMSNISLEALTKYLGAQRIIYSGDYPYGRSPKFASFLWDSNLSDAEKYMIARGNAKKVFRLVVS